MQTAVDPLVGRTLEGRYRILDRIARGGMSTVYAAVDERLDRLVAVKVMSAALSADPSFTDRFAREARAAARLTHLNVVSVYDQGHDYAADGHHVFLVMELVEGRTLRELLRERGRLTVPEALSVMEPVLSALASAHRAGLVHRDVKPENILLSDQGVVKVADFGLARAVESDPSNTRTGLMMGTIAYCAPEQLSRGVSDPRSDVYSAGIVFFELLTGSPPYRGETAMNIAYQHVHSRVPAPSSRVRGVPEPVDELVVAATDSDPSGRPSDAGAFLAELADLRTALALPVTPVPPRPRTPRRPGATAGTTPLGSSAGAATEAFRTRAMDGEGRSVGVGTVVADGSRPPHAQPGRGRTTDRLASANGAPPPPVVVPPPRSTTRLDPRRRRRRRGVIGFVLVVLIGLGAFFGAQALIKWRFAHVPDVFGLPRPSAVAKLQDAGYDVHVEPGPLYNEEVKAGDVVQTRPSAGQQLATGKTVLVTLSAGPHRYEIPDVSGKSFEAAVSALRAVGPVHVQNTPVQTFSKTVAEGDVIRTAPPAGRQVTRSQPIRVWVSKGPPRVAIPDVTSLPLAQARHKLRKAGFTTNHTVEYSDTVSAGDVIRTEPAGRARWGSPVVVVVSRGPHMVTVPDIPFGTPLDQAEQTLREAGLVPEPHVVGSDGVNTYALSTDPHGGVQVHVGATVTVVAYSM